MAGGQTAVAQETYYTNPANTPAGYYYWVAAWNTDLAMAVNENLEPIIDNLDKTDARFIWYVSGRNQLGEENNGKLLSECGGTGNGDRISFYWCDPTWGKFLAGDNTGQNHAIEAVGSSTMGMSGWREVSDASFRFNVSNRGRDFSPETVNQAGSRLWTYGNRGDNAKYKLLPVSDEQVAAMKALTADGVIAAWKAKAAIPDAIAAFNALKTANSTQAAKGYSYELTTEEETLLATNYDESAGYAGLDTDEVNALKAQFVALMEKIQSTYAFENVTVVTLSWNGSNYVGGFGGGNTWNQFGNPNGGNGKIGLIKVDGSGTLPEYVIGTQGYYHRINGGNKETTADIANATHYHIIGNPTDGITFRTVDGTYYLNANQLNVSTDAQTQNYKVNTFNTANLYYAKANEDMTEVSDGLYMTAVCLPYKVTKPDGAGYHTYKVTIDGSTLTTTEVDEVEAGQPFIYVAPVNTDAKRLLIAQTNQAYAAPTTNTFLRGYTISNDNQSGTGAFYFGVKNGVAGFYSDVDPGTVVNRAYIASGAFAGATKFVWNVTENKLEAVMQSAEYLALQDEIAAAEGLVTNKKNDNGLDALNAAITTAKGYEDNDADELTAALSVLQTAEETFLVAQNTSQLVADTPLTIEAENPRWLPVSNPAVKQAVMDGGSATVDETTFLTFDNSASKRFQAAYYVNVPAGAAGTYDFTGVHGTWNTRNMLVQVNDEIVHMTTTQGTTASEWNVPDGAIEPFKVNLKEGLNTILIQGVFRYSDVAPSENNCTAPALDKFTLTKADADIEIPTGYKSADIQGHDYVSGNGSLEKRNFKYQNGLGIDNAATATYTINVPATGAYLLEYVYATAQDRNLGITVNDDARVVAQFSSNGSWNDATWGRSILVYLRKGDNTLVLDGNNDNSPIIDFFTLTRVQTEGFDYSKNLSLPITAAGYATYYTDASLDFTGVTGLTAYTATVSGTTVTFNEVTGAVPAETGLLLKGETTNVPVTTKAVAAVENAFEGVLTDTEKAAGIFVLMNGDEGVGFYKTNNDFTVRANSAYLPASVVAAARTFIGFSDGETTGISELKAGQQNAAIYNLNGVRVQQPTKGLYIVNGKKVVR